MGRQLGALNFASWSILAHNKRQSRAPLFGSCGTLMMPPAHRRPLRPTGGVHLRLTKQKLLQTYSYVFDVNMFFYPKTQPGIKRP